MKTNALFVRIYGLNCHLKCSFKSILEKKHQHFYLQRPLFVWPTWNIYRSVTIPWNIHYSEKFQAARLNLGAV